MFKFKREKPYFLSVELLFLLGMWLSKTAWPLWFQKSGDLRYYGLSYSVMAATGMLSLVFGALLQKWGARRGLLAGLPLYACGIGLRFWNQSWEAAVLSGLCGGIGASLVLLSLRTTARTLQVGAIDTRFMAARKTLQNVAMGGAGIVIAYLLSEELDGYSIWIGILPLALAWALAQGFRDEKTPATRLVPVRLRSLLLDTRLRSFLLLSFVGGAFTSLILPYLPLYFSNLGMSAAQVSLLGTVATLAGLGAQPIAHRLQHSLGTRGAFIVGEGLFLGAILGMLLSQSIVLIPVLVGVRVVGRSISLLSEDVLETGQVKPATSAAYYGASQTMFLMGDSLGGACGGFLAAWNLETAIWVGSALACVHAAIWMAASRSAAFEDR